jgi:hypothetical protein
MPKADMVLLDKARLSRAITRAELLRGELAEKAKISTTSISDAFAGRPLGLGSARAIARALGCALVDLMLNEPIAAGAA